MPQRILVNVESDHLDRLATSKSPLAAIQELIWNALDADATRIEVHLDRNPLGGLETITVADNGYGLAHEEALNVFARLGGSWKMGKNRTLSGRVLHGQQGKGRFLTFALGSHAQWLTRYRENNTTFEYVIEGTRANLREFFIDDPKAVNSVTGTVVTVTGIERTPSSLVAERARQQLTEEFALYLRQHAGITIVYDGIAVDPSGVEDFVADYELPDIHVGINRVSASLTIVEWLVPTDRSLFLCDENGLSLHRVPPGVQARGFTFTAYLKSAYIRELSERGELALEELSPEVRPLIEAAKNQLKTHFRNRTAERSKSIVDQWKHEDVYPYEGVPANPVEQAERQVFDVLALNVYEYLPEFDVSSRENRQLSFRLLRTAIETSPEAVQLILRDVLNLPKEKMDELAQLLERTSLEAIINASRIVADRLDFLHGLELLVFDPELRGKTLERRHLHRIVAEHTWVFGEEFNLTVSDKSLNAVLRRHLDLAKIELMDDTPVVREDGSQAIIDLMLSRVVPQPRQDQNEHLIVELKRPSVAIGSEEAGQIKSYATAIATDDRFRATNTRWEFWAVSTEISDSVRIESNQADRAPGILLDASQQYGFRVWVKTWGQIIEDCRARLKFFQERLNYVADEDSSIAYLRRVHEKYLPDPLKDDDTGKAPLN